jgi:hypothetical protein
VIMIRTLQTSSAFHIPPKPDSQILRFRKNLRNFGPEISEKNDERKKPNENNNNKYENQSIT